MKFKNYRNPKTNDNRIYSHKDMFNMSLKELNNKKEELISQMKILGIPKDKELASSDNVVWVNEYTKEDGTIVSGHWRSKSNDSISDETNKKEKQITNVQDSEKYADETPEYYCQEIQDYVPETEEYKREYKKQENLKSIERNDPEEIAGVKRGEPMTFEEMTQKGVNPNYNGDDNSGYAKNCQSCNVACELIMRGYDVEACSYDNLVAQELAKNENSAYLNPITDEKCVPQEIDLEKEYCYEHLEKTIKIGERYEFIYNLTPTNGEYTDTQSHAVFMTRINGNNLVIYDGQNGKVFYGPKQVKSFILANINRNNTKYYPRILRVDDKKINPYYTDKVVRKSDGD